MVTLLPRLSSSRQKLSTSSVEPGGTSGLPVWVWYQRSSSHTCQNASLANYRATESPAPAPCECLDAYKKALCAAPLSNINIFLHASAKSSQYLCRFLILWLDKNGRLQTQATCVWQTARASRLSPTADHKIHNRASAESTSMLAYCKTHSLRTVLFFAFLC